MSAQREIGYVCAARAVRAFGDGFAIIILPAYLTEIGLTPLWIGVVATSALLGSAAMRTAAAIGDDTLQRKATGHVVPDSFTHGSSEQRQRWFQTGLKEGTVGACNTFASTGL